MYKLAIISLSLAVTVVTPGYAASPSPTTTNPYGGVKIDPLGPNETILILSHGKQVVKLSLNALLALRTSEVSVFEPFVQTRQKFTAIKLANLFKLVGIKEKNQVSTVALNDYVYANTAKAFLAADGYLAIKRNGELIPYDQGGPIRIIYPDTSRWSKYLDPWNWSLTRISAK